MALQWGGDPSYERVAALARGIVAGLAASIARQRHLYLILDSDLAQTLGGVLRDDLGVGSELLVIDGIALVDFDYIDLGRIRLPSYTVPVTVKSLVFNDLLVGSSHAHPHDPCARPPPPSSSRPYARPHEEQRSSIGCLKNLSSRKNSRRSSLRKRSRRTRTGCVPKVWTSSVPCTCRTSIR